MHRSRSVRRTWIHSFPILALTLFALAALTGCGDEPTKPEPASLPAIGGAIVPETIEEGQSVEIQIWGTCPESGWGLTGFDVTSSGEMIEIRPVGRRGSGRGIGGGEFSAYATLPACAAGAHTVRIHGANGRIDYPIHVLPRDTMVRYSAEGPRGARFEELVITADGWAVAVRRGDVPPVRVALSAEAIAQVREQFAAAGFMDLEDRYVSDPPADSLLFKVVYRPDSEHRKRVVAESGLAPQALRELAFQLHQMTSRILQDAPPPPIVTGSVEVRPPAGDVGSTRTIVLTLRNRSTESVTLHFPTTQLYDVAIVGGEPSDSMRQGHMGDGMPGGGMPDGGMPGGGNMPGGGMHGNGPRNGDHPGDPTDPPPMHAVVWNWAYGRGFDPTPTDLVFEAGQERSFEIEWPGTTNDGGVVPIGAYAVMVHVPAESMVRVPPAGLVVGNPSPPLVVRFAVEPRSAPSGTPRTLRLSIGNPGPDPVTLRFGSTQVYDFLLDDPMTMMPGWDWIWSSLKDFPAVMTELTIPPGGRLEYSEPWNGRIAPDHRMRPGVYPMQAVLMLPDRPASLPVMIEVTR